MFYIGNPYPNAGGDIQCDASGSLGEYVIRQNSDGTWVSIPLFDISGAFSSIGATPQEAFDLAEQSYTSNKSQNRMKMTLVIEGLDTDDLEDALKQALSLLSQGYLSGRDKNDFGSYSFSVESLN